MKLREVVVLAEAADDLEQGKRFYGLRGQGLGDYFADSLLADIESLSFFAGIHARANGYHRMLAGKFPFSIYYAFDDASVMVVAVLDMRRNPAWNRRHLRGRKP